MVIVTLVVVSEVGFWVLLAAGLGLRYGLRRRRAGGVVLLMEPALEVVLLVAGVVDLGRGAEPDWKHGLAAVYLGFTVTHGRYAVAWADRHAAHRLAGGPRPAKPPRYGRARAVHEWKMGARAMGGAAIAAVLLQGAIWYVGDPAQAAPLRDWQTKMAFVAGISALIAASYTLWPKRAPTSEDVPAGR
ncbi:hypothetical protein [Streptomyces xiaopingdaonensis]|uniref:hypothetical protein n=1 Tax=Streptomyces xiaopingdaonensis TaxID=1565415 RepID=UPI00031334C5